VSLGNANGSKPIEDYALIGDGHTVALVARDGSIDWLCWPRFDSDACFSALLGTEDHGFWRIAPAAAATATRRYHGDDLVIETEFIVAGGSLRLRCADQSGTRAYAARPFWFAVTRGGRTLGA